MKQVKIKSVTQGYDKMYKFTTECGEVWYDDTKRYNVGDIVELIPFMGAVLTKLVRTGGAS